MYETLTFTGGVHKSEEMEELIEDLGGFVCSSKKYFTDGTGY